LGAGYVIVHSACRSKRILRRKMNGQIRRYRTSI
jgi:hypothetical protein